MGKMLVPMGIRAYPEIFSAVIESLPSLAMQAQRQVAPPRPAAMQV